MATGICYLKIWSGQDQCGKPKISDPEFRIGLRTEDAKGSITRYVCTKIHAWHHACVRTCTSTHTLALLHAYICLHACLPACMQKFQKTDLQLLAKAIFQSKAEPVNTLQSHY